MSGPPRWRAFITASWLIRQGNAVGWIPLIVGTLLVRAVFEVMILFLRIYESVSGIHAAFEADRAP